MPYLRPGVRINLGCGDRRREGWVNVDLRSDVADVVADVSALPFPDGSVDEIWASDIAEHFPRERLPAVVGEWRRVLRPGGTLTLRVPNLLKLAEAIVRHADDPDRFIENVYGGHRWGPDGAWDAHHWGWTPQTFARDLKGWGFEVVSNDAASNMTVVARKAGQD